MGAVASGEESLSIDPDAYAAFVARVAQRYEGRVEARVIWNEPSLAQEWGRGPGATSRGLRGADAGRVSGGQGGRSQVPPSTWAPDWTRTAQCPHEDDIDSKARAALWLSVPQEKDGHRPLRTIGGNIMSMEFVCR